MKNSTPSRNRNKQKKFPVRLVSVYGKAFPRAYGRYVYYPEIRLAGKWLQEAGFKTTMKVKISCEYRKLIITVDTTKNTYLQR
ncbi:SymE family type I addiction module toxin [Flavobacterium supellecticarium]|nr:SymE family type I addiction module toxin [Flavobacterium supellecticarium]